MIIPYYQWLVNLLAYGTGCYIFFFSVAFELRESILALCHGKMALEAFAGNANYFFYQISPYRFDSNEQQNKYTMYVKKLAELTENSVEVIDFILNNLYKIIGNDIKRKFLSDGISTNDLVRIFNENQEKILSDATLRLFLPNPQIEGSLLKSLSVLAFNNKNYSLQAVIKSGVFLDALKLFLFGKN